MCTKKKKNGHIITVVTVSVREWKQILFMNQKIKIKANNNKTSENNKTKAKLK